MVAVRLSLALIGLLAIGGACASGGPASEPVAPMAEATPPPSPAFDMGESEQSAPPAARGLRPSGARAPSRPAPAPAPVSADALRTTPAASPEVQAEDSVRDWFPETFLWVPAVETDDDGLAEIEVQVPDTLTRWRVLGLAHDRGGQQAGALTGFASRLPVYVEPQIPAFLFTGDRLELPVRAGNGTEAALRVSLSVASEGALSGGGEAAATIGSGGVSGRTFTLRAARGGSATVRAAVSGQGTRDEVVRTLRVSPSGTPVEVGAAGTLTDEVALALPPSPGGSDEELVVTVLSGPLALLRGELERISGGGYAALPGYGLALAAEVEAAAERAGAEVDAASLRSVRLLAFQSVVRSLSTASPATAADLLLAGGRDRTVGGYEAAVPALVQHVVRAQRPDGTWSWTDRSTLQRVLVETAHAAAALPQDEITARLRASGAAERHAPAVTDPYTAAVLLGSGLADGPVGAVLVERVRGGLARDEAGVPSVAVPRDVLDAWGEVPSEVEVLAWTVLALPEDDPDRGPLAAEIAGRWTPEGGFGAGRADLVALRAVLAAAPGADRPASVRLEVDGAPAAEARLDPSDASAPIVLRAPAGADPRLVLEPPVSGVLWRAVRRSWVPLDPASAGLPGIEVEVTPGPLRAGVEGTLRIEVSAPQRVRLTVEQGLPAGAAIDAARIRAQAGVTAVVPLPDRVRISLAPSSGGLHQLEIPVTPAFGGRFTTVPLRITVDDGASGAWPPAVWEVL